MNEMAYQICVRCVMDTSDPDIRFDSNGVCNHCHDYDVAIRTRVYTGEKGRARLAQLVEEMRRAGRKHDYDCVIGVSGGVDSTYTAYKVKELGLRPLAVHLDNGWDSELAVKNIEQTLKRLGIDLYTHVIDWEEFRDLQVAFLRASTPDSEIPSDHAIFSLMLQTACRLRIKHIIFGFNVRSESHLPPSWSHGHWDWRYIRSIHRIYGSRPLTTFPHMNLLEYYRYKFTKEWVDLLNYIDYVKADAKPLLERELGWRDYGGKHYESIYTRFYQGYILPRKFGYDKRRVHFSSLICSGEITREQALDDLEHEPYPVDQQAQDLSYVVKKLGLTQDEFEGIMRLPKKSYWDYPSYGKWFRNPLYQGLRRMYHSAKRQRVAF